MLFLDCNADKTPCKRQCTYWDALAVTEPRSMAYALRKGLVSPPVERRFGAVRVSCSFQCRVSR
jgi:hypothetical protein